MSDGDDIQDVLEPALDGAKDTTDDAGKAASSVGEGKQDLDQAEDDLSDGDQDTADKASNAGHGAADALDHGADALNVLGISDPGLGSLADAIDQGTETLFGKKHAPDSLPPLRYRVFFGKADPFDALGESLLSDMLGAGDAALESVTGGIADYVGTDPLSSVMAKRSPFAEDTDELDAAESMWKVARVDVTEALSELWRAELLLVAPELRDPAKEDELAAAGAGGGLLDQITGPIQSAIGAFNGAKDAIANGTGSGPIADRIHGISDAFQRLTSDPLGALRDAVFGGPEWSQTEETVNVNVPLDPGRFLGQTCSLRVSREFSGEPDPAHPNDVPDHPFSARYLTGVVVEIEDLGQGSMRTPSDFQPRFQITDDGLKRAPDGQRWIRLVVMPELGKLALRRDHRVFNDMSALEIVREVLRSAGVYGSVPDIPGVGAATGFVSGIVESIPFVGGAASDALTGQHVRMIPPAGVTEGEWTMKRELCVQYGETDLDFVRRLLEEEGIHFAFEHRRGFERLVLTHGFEELDEVATVDGRPARFFWPHWSGRPNVETIRAVAERRRVRPTKVCLRDVTFSSPDRGCDEQEAPPDRPDLGHAETEPVGAYGVRYEYPAPFPYQYAEPASEAEPPRYLRYGEQGSERDYARLRLEEEASRARGVVLRSDLIAIEPGRRIRMRGYPFQRDGQVPDPTIDPPQADVVVVERVRWRGGTAALTDGAITGPRFALPDADDLADYENEIHGAWIDPRDATQTPVRPARRTPKPRITSLQTATVVDYEGDHDEDEEIDVDHLALRRILVRFHWDRRGELPFGLALPVIGRGTSCRCRVAQPWAGDDFGVLFVPRIGSEVVVAFEEGDPDRPIVIGSLYDGEHPVPTPGVETRREGFEPPKAAAVQLSTIATRTSPWDEDEGVRSELTFDDTFERERVLLKAGGHYVEEVRGAHARTVDRDQSNEVARHHGEIVEGTQTVTIGGARTEAVAGAEVVAVHGRRERTVVGDQTITIKGSHEERVQGCVSLRVDGARSLVIHGMRSTVIGDLEASPPRPAHDLHTIGGAKTDTIEGALTVRANALAVGQPGGPAGEVVPAGRLEARQSADGDPEVQMQSEGGVRMLAPAGEVRIESRTGEVDIELRAGLSATVGTSAVRLNDPDAGGGVQVESFSSVTFQAGPAEGAITGAEVSLRAKGEAEAMLEVGAAGVALHGQTGVIRASVEVAGGAQVTKVGP